MVDSENGDLHRAGGGSVVSSQKGKSAGGRESGKLHRAVRAKMLHRAWKLW